VKGNWIDYSGVAFNISAPEGHLPRMSGEGYLLFGIGGVGRISFLASRLEKFNV
jgi:hypothetical protein